MSTGYKALKNAIVEIFTGKQVAVVLPSNCTKKQAHEMAAFCAQQMNQMHACVFADRAAREKK